MSIDYLYFIVIFFYKQKTAYEMRSSDWSADVCSSDLASGMVDGGLPRPVARLRRSRGARGAVPGSALRRPQHESRRQQARSSEDQRQRREFESGMAIAVTGTQPRGDRKSVV